MPNPHIGYGALLAKGDGNSPQNFISVLGIKGITGPNMTRDTIDTTDMSGDGWRTFVGGLVDAGEVSFDANFLPTDDTQNQEPGGFMAEFDKGSCDSVGDWRIVLPECAGQSEGYFEFNGVVSGQSVTIPMADLMGFSGTVKISGRPRLVLST